MSGAGTNAGRALPLAWQPALGTPSQDRSRLHATFLTRLRAAHCSGTALALAAESWVRAARSAPVSLAFGQMQSEAEEGVHRIEYILSCLGRGARGGTPWIDGRDLAVPAEADDTRLLALARWALMRMSCGTLDLGTLAHACGEYQAARLLQMSVDEQLTTARLLATILPNATTDLPTWRAQ
jgi:ferritin-like metal-binding protein YciE